MEYKGKNRKDPKNVTPFNSVTRREITVLKLSQFNRAMFLVAFNKELLQQMTLERNIADAERKEAVWRCGEIETKLSQTKRQLQVVSGWHRRAVAKRDQSNFLTRSESLLCEARAQESVGHCCSSLSGAKRLPDPIAHQLRPTATVTRQAPLSFPVVSRRTAEMAIEKKNRTLKEQRLI